MQGESKSSYVRFNQDGGGDDVMFQVMDTGYQSNMLRTFLVHFTSAFRQVRFLHVNFLLVTAFWRMNSAWMVSGD